MKFPMIGKIVPIITHETAISMEFMRFFNDLEALALEWQSAGVTLEDAKATPILAAYKGYLFQGLFPIALEVAYKQITQGQDDGASIQTYWQAQAPELRAL